MRFFYYHMNKYNNMNLRIYAKQETCPIYQIGNRQGNVINSNNYIFTKLSTHTRIIINIKATVNVLMTHKQRIR